MIIPVLNERENLPALLNAIPGYADRVIVADNGSTDGSIEVLQAEVQKRTRLILVQEPERGYGAACLRGLGEVEGADIVLFLDADLSDDPANAPLLLDPIVGRDADMVISNRFTDALEPAALSLPQYFGNKLAVFLVRIFWRYRYHDLGPFRSIRMDALKRLDMRDRNYGWTIEMQVKAVQKQLQIAQVDVPYHSRRAGSSKVSGTVHGILRAGIKILYLIVKMKIQEMFRRQRPGSPG